MTELIAGLSEMVGFPLVPQLYSPQLTTAHGGC
jgi:hypothetical protein